MGIESVVRPAQLPDNKPPRTIRQRRSARNWQPIVFKIGVGGEFSTGSASISQSVSYYAKRRPTEKKTSGSSLGFSDLNITFP